MSEVKMNEALRTMADKIKGNMAIGDDGIVAVEKDTYASILKEETGIEMSQVKAQQEFDGLYASASHVAQGELAAEFFKAHSDINMVTSKQPIAKDKLAVRTHRSKSYPVPNSDQTVTNYCQTAVIWDKFGGGTNARQAKEHVQSMAKALLAE